MEWYKNLYLGEKAAKKHFKLLRKINKRRLTNAYVVTLPSNSENVLDIYSYNELLQKHYDSSRIFVVGLAYGKEEAMELTKDIILDVYLKSGTVKVSEYIMGDPCDVDLKKGEDFHP